MHEVQRAHRPCAVELILELVFVGEMIEARAGRLVGGRHNEQHGALAVIVQSPAAAKDALAVLPQDLGAAVRIVYTRVDQRKLSGPGDFIAVDRFHAAGRYENRGPCQRRARLDRRAGEDIT